MNVYLSRFRSTAAIVLASTLGAIATACGVADGGATATPAATGAASAPAQPGTAVPAPAAQPATSSESPVIVSSPVDGAEVTGLLNFRAAVDGAAPGSYSMSWQVDGDRLNPMTDSGEQKEAYVDVSGWTWKGAGPYVLNFVAKDASGKVLGEKAVSIRVRQR